MKTLWTALVLLATPLTIFAQVSKEEVRRLLDAHVSEQTIVSYVQRNGPIEVLSVEDLGDLKSAGASDNLLQALIQAQTSSSYRPPSTDSTPYTTTPDTPESSSTVIYDSPQYYSYPDTAYSSYSDSYPAPYYYYYSYYPTYYPYRYYSYYPYRGHSGYYGTHQHPNNPVQSGGVNVYRQSPQSRTVTPQTMTPRTVAPQPVAPQPQAPSTSVPRGGGGIPRR